MGAVLVTGCTGLLGANLCHILRDGNTIVGLSRSPFGMRGVEHFPVSFEDADAVARIVEENRIDCVIHCAALTNVDACERDPATTMRVNCASSIRLAQAASAQGARFVLISSDAVFNGAKDGPYGEDDATCPINVYGESKARAEEGVLALPDALVIRTNLYGINYQDKNSFGEWVAGSLSRGERLTMFDDVAFSPLVADELSRAIADVVALGAVGILNLASTGGMTKYAFGVELQRRMNLGGIVEPVSVDDFDFAARRSHNMVLDNSRASLLLNRRLPTPGEGIDHFIELYTNGFRERLREGTA